MTIAPRLDKERCDPVGVAAGDAQPDGSPVVLNVEGELLETELVEQLQRDGGQVLKRVLELVDRGCVGEPVSHVIGSDDVVAVRQFGNQVPEHVGRGRETVQEHNGRSGRIACLTVEDLASVHGGGAVLNH
ncbi:hypothetical protein GCM10009609_48460 [Pseudonocardia aurantiaca]